MAKNEDDIDLLPLNKFPEIKELENKLYEVPSEEKQILFKEYSLALLELYKRGEINTQTMAYCIGGTMLISELKDIEEIDSLIWEARILELSYEEAYGSKQEYMYEWNGFVNRLESLGLEE